MRLHNTRAKGSFYSCKANQRKHKTDQDYAIPKVPDIDKVRHRTNTEQRNKCTTGSGFEQDLLENRNFVEKAKESLKTDITQYRNCMS